jgi:hypothetical protein
MSEFAMTYRAEGWAPLKEFLRLESEGWVFRGHRRTGWPLKSALERTEAEDKAAHERELVDAFRRRAAVHVAPQIVPTDTFGWMGLMQHYGAPTRLLDWTRSPYVAVFFAVEDTNEEEGDRALWAIYTPVLQWACVKALVASGLSRDTAEALVFTRSHELVSELVAGTVTADAVFPVEPWQFDFRQAVQQSIFLCPGNVMKSFRDNLRAVAALCEPDWPGPAVVKVEIGPNVRREALQDLRMMNVTAASLFPGLDGFARSLRTAFVEHERAVPPMARALKAVDLTGVPADPLADEP